MTVVDCSWKHVFAIMLQNFWKILRACFLSTTYIVLYCPSVSISVIHQWRRSSSRLELSGSLLKTTTTRIHHHQWSSVSASVSDIRQVFRSWCIPQCSWMGGSKKWKHWAELQNHRTSWTSSLQWRFQRSLRLCSSRDVRWYSLPRSGSGNWSPEVQILRRSTQR